MGLEHSPANFREGEEPVVTIPAALTVKQILNWADAHHRRTGRWPLHRSGAIPEAPRENWAIIEAALRLGLRGLPGGDSLPRLLARMRKRAGKSAGQQRQVTRPALESARSIR